MTRKKSLDDVHQFMKDEDYQKAVECLRDGMDATHIVRESKGNGERGVNYKEVIDHSTRISSAKLMLEYGFGKPATRQDINITDNTRLHATPSEVMGRLMSSGQDLANIMEVYTESVRETPVELENHG
tara:strand:- start:398 stop:781 length:384 start_codon:yes stop_codon:yes gene_type:complete